MPIPTFFLDPSVRQYINDKRKITDDFAKSGFACGRVVEPIPKRPKAPCEIVHEGLNNATIVLGRDRPGTILSGAGGAKQTQCGMIDLVAGRMSSIICEEIKKEVSGAAAVGSSAANFLGNIGNPSAPGTALGKRGVSNISESDMSPNFFADAARVYISQRTLKIDDYLGFKYTGVETEGLSAVAIKADCTRLIGRENVRIYAGGASGEGFSSSGEPRSNNTSIKSPKIELIVGNKGEDNLQPAVLGKNLISYIRKNNKINNRLISVLEHLITRVATNSTALVPLTLGLYGPVAGAHITQSVEDIITIVRKLMSEITNDINHLNTAIIPGKKSILSSNVFIT